MSKAGNVLDGPTIEKLQQVIQEKVTAYGADPQAAQATFRAKSHTVKGFKTVAGARGFSQIIDEPEELGGTNDGPNPVEVLLGSLGACQQIVIAAYAAALGIELEAVEIEARGDIDLRGLFNVAAVPAGFQSIDFQVRISAPEATAEQLEQLKILALEHCPVLDTLQRPVPVRSVYRFEFPTQEAVA